MILLVDRPKLAEGDVNTGEFCTARWTTPLYTPVQCTLHIHVRRQRKRRVKHNHGPIVVSIFLSVSYGQNLHSKYWRTQREDCHLLLSLIEMHFQQLQLQIALATGSANQYHHKEEGLTSLGASIPTGSCQLCVKVTEQLTGLNI